MSLVLIGIYHVISLKKLKTHPKNVQISPKKIGGGGGGGVGNSAIIWKTNFLLYERRLQQTNKRITVIDGIHRDVRLLGYRRIPL